MKPFLGLDYRESIRKVVKKRLKEEYGIKVPKEKPKPQEEDNPPGRIFGRHLENVPSINTGIDYYNPIPRFLIDSVAFLKPHLKTEGLFRKSGSLTRQKMVRQMLENGEEMDTELVQPHDIASLMKQFFRELPDPLLSYRLHDCFIKCLQLNTLKERIASILLLCLLLPDSHLRVLQYLSLFVSEVANHCQGSKMGLGNLAIVLTPNLMFSIKDRSGEKGLKEQTQIVDLLFRKATDIALVPESIVQQALESELDPTNFSASSGDEVETPREQRQRRMRRRRSRSISAFVRKLKNNPASFDNSKSIERPATLHKRSRSDHLIILKDDTDKLDNEETTEPNTGDPYVHDVVVIDANQKIAQRLRSLKRKPVESKKKPPSPIRKSPRLAKKPEPYQNITSPRLVSLPTQYMLTPKHHLQPVQRPLSSGKTLHTEDSLPLTPSTRFLSDLENSTLTPGSKVRKSVKYNLQRNRPVKPARSHSESTEHVSTTPVLTKENAIPSPSCPNSLNGPSTPQSVKIHGGTLPSTRYPLTPKIDAQNLESWRKKPVTETVSNP